LTLLGTVSYTGLDALDARGGTMKVRDTAAGTDRLTSTDDYSKQVAKLLKARLVLRLEQAPMDVFPSPEELVARMADLVVVTEDMDNPIADLLSPFWSGSKVGRELGDAKPLSRQALAERRKNGSLLGLSTSDNKTVYPVAQFHRVGGQVEVRPGVKAMLSVLRHADPWSVALVVLSANPVEELGGMSPLEAMERGVGLERLTSYADVVRREWEVRR
jgi:hypothetical protein